MTGSSTQFVVESVAPFQIGDLVRPGNLAEVLLVTAVSASQKRLTVTRSYGGTPQGVLLNGLGLTVIGNARLEGAEAAAARFTGRVRRSNWTQIMSSTVDVSGSLQASSVHAVESEVDYQRQERMRELLRDLENTVINGVAPAADAQGSSSVRRTMRGIRSFIETNVFEPGSGAIPDGDGAGSDQLSESVLNAALREIWERSSGAVDTIVCGGSQKRRINGFATGSRAYLPEDTRYRDLVSVYESDFGVCRVILSRWVRPDTVLLLDSSRVQVMPLRGRSFHYKPLAATGDSVTGQVIGEYTLELKNELAHGAIEGLAA